MGGLGGNDVRRFPSPAYVGTRTCVEEPVVGQACDPNGPFCIGGGLCDPTSMTCVLRPTAGACS